MSPALLSIILIASNFASNISKSSPLVRQTGIAKFLLTIWQSYVAKFMWAIWCDPIAKQYLIGFVALIGLEGVNIVFSQVSLILLLPSFSSIFATSLLIIILHLSWLRGTPISYPVLLPFVLWIPRRTCAPMFLEYITRFLKVRRSWEPGTRISTIILSPFRLSLQRFLVQTSIGWLRIIPFLLV